ncbi:MAG: NUDIX hydrolase [Bacteroidia bacterium]|nr:NUDIX hydrolase [Bacteroidia bacterium]
MKYCSNCGSDRLELRIPKGDNRARYVCSNCGTIHYSNPNMVVGCLPFYEDKILLCKRAIEPRSGYWNLPAGYLENGETAEDGAVRECIEEAGIEVNVIGIHCIYSIPRINQVYCFFLAEMLKPEWEIGEETLEADLFAYDDIPYDEIAFPSSIYAIKKYLGDVKNSERNSHLGSWRT